MLDANAVTQLVGSLGFPIVACGAMFWKMNKQDQDHKEEMTKVTEAVNNNTEAIIRLTEHMKGET